MILETLTLILQVIVLFFQCFSLMLLEKDRTRLKQSKLQNNAGKDNPCGPVNERN